MLNIPNCITLARLVLVVLFTIVLALPLSGEARTMAHIVACWFFVIGALSDYLDGYLARKLNQVTNFGKLIDPLADKILVCAAFIYLSTVGLCPFWVTIVIMFREFLVTGLRQLAVEKDIVIAADIYGKWKTIFQLGYCMFALVHLAHGQSDNPVLAFLSQGAFNTWGMEIFLWVSVTLTLFSGANYCIKARHILH